MVLWEITLGTAYFLGIKRTYRLALKLQQRLVRRPKIRAFLRRRTRVAFDVALSVHKKVQQRDLEVGRNLGNWMLRWLDRLKPSAQIRTSPPPKAPPNNSSIPRNTTSSRLPMENQNHHSIKITNSDSRHLFSSRWTARAKPFPTIAMMMHPPNTAAAINQYRHIFNSTGLIGNTTFGVGTRGVLRKDIEQWMLRN